VTRLSVQAQYSVRFATAAAALFVVLYGWLFVGSSVAAEADLKVGETIGPQNWQKIQGMVGENLLNRIKGGYTLQIKAPKIYQPLKEYVEATEKYSGKVLQRHRARAVRSGARAESRRDPCRRR
jgi:hypothetical protein